MKKLITIFILILLYCVTFGQDAKIREGEVVFTIDKRLPKSDIDSICTQYGMEDIHIDSLIKFEVIKGLDAEGWKVRSSGKFILEIYKDLQEVSGNFFLDDLFFLPDEKKIDQNNRFLYPQASYGVNEFKRKVVFDKNKAKTIFFLPGNYNANQVYLSGSFNQWSTYDDPMTKTDSGWVREVYIEPGKHLYKFIIDNRWYHDEFNELKENDGAGGYNSVYFKYNFRFFLSRRDDARKVFVAGSFNNWNKKELRLMQTSEGWELPLFLKEGTHAYKFVVDGKWILDPGGKPVRSDGRGNFNSFCAIGDTTNFFLGGNENAHQVILTGDFNAWNTAELEMLKTDSGWVLPYVLPQGNYLYKFIVDGQWITDPANPHTEGSGQYLNSVISIQANHRFSLSAYSDAKSVAVSGDFNGWNNSGYRLKKTHSQWLIDVYLPPGKQRYKFIIDGEWMIDPSNPHWEDNQYNTGNSVVWIN